MGDLSREQKTQDGNTHQMGHQSITGDQMHIYIHTHSNSGKVSKSTYQLVFQEAEGKYENPERKQHRHQSKLR